ncbi:putative short-subunit dehydrogenase-like oxidoreductase (DUF2520 family) [Sphingopyxis panaciterrae]|uniref:Rossmann-like and DUF2520 domain-containing protein n=1 Tax=Sphingopyxis panaciterrae TaxID=363841 RepID=UPI00142198BF|nr:Rossmann-like and DUF2520 domain-containing protein [Sphingopyxis panaciterrae]NIJ36855.1 putative short-subunit dehydrogenase-like oxidoreductase (DUF2520 family) [Sphingopyxis panaciterrae]
MTNPSLHQFGIVGSGRVAQALAQALAPHSVAPPVLWGRSPEKLQAAVARVDRAAASSSIHQLASACDVIAIAVSDDAIGAVTADLAAALPADRAPFVFHVSGRSGAAILEPLCAAGALTAAIHPAMTFTGDPQQEAGRMAEARFAITGSTPAAIQRARHIVALLEGIAVEIAEDRRPLYHAALCHASNHLVTLMTGASHALEKAGVHDPAGLLAPLVRAALENSLKQGFSGLSGPLLRGDDRTIGSHLDALDTWYPDLLPAYRAMALATLDELERSGSPVASALYSRLR